MTGWRLGYLAAPKHFTTAANRIQSQVSVNRVTYKVMINFSFLKGPSETASVLCSVCCVTLTQRLGHI